MKRLGELSNVNLLYEVKEYVMRSQRDLTEEIEDSAVGCLVSFADSAWKNGVVGLEKEVRHYPKDIPLFVDMMLGAKCIMEGIKEEKLLEILVENYWSMENKGREVLARYLGIIAIMKISEGISPRELQNILYCQLVEYNEIVGVNKEW